MMWPETVFVGCSALVIYVLLGYPLLVGRLAARRGRPVRKRFEEKSVSVLLPVRNGERWLRGKLGSILKLDYPRQQLQIIVVSDGSEDATDAMAREFAARGEIEFLRIAPGGKAAALDAGMELARGEILFFTDVRQELEPASLRELVAALGDPEVGVASGELIIREGATRQEADVGLYWTYEKWMRRRLSDIDSVLGATGAIYAMRRELARPLPRRTILDDVYLPLAAFFAGYRVILDERARAYDDPTQLRTEFWRKVRTLAGNYQLLRYYPRLLSPANRMWLHYLSHKFGRLLLPFLLIGIAASSLWLAEPLRMAALLLQALFYGLALADGAVPEGWRLKRLSSPAWTFVVFMAAALCAASILVVPAERLWSTGRRGGTD